MAQRQPRSSNGRQSEPSADELAEAVCAAQSGAEPAFSVLYRTVQPGLLRYLGALVGPDAEDIASETWLQVCRDLHTFRGDGDGFRGWVATIGRHRALDHIRARGRRPADPYPVEFLTGVASQDDTASAAVEAMSTAAALRMIGGLPVDQAEAVLLRTVVGLDAASAGRVLGKRPGAVRMSAHRGLRSLARRLDERAGVSTATADGVTASQPDALNGMT